MFDNVHVTTNQIYHQFYLTTNSFDIIRKRTKTNNFNHFSLFLKLLFYIHFNLNMFLVTQCLKFAYPRLRHTDIEDK